MSRLRLRPITHRDAKAYIREHHRHCDAPVGFIHVAGVFVGSNLVGVGVSGRPIARMLDDGLTIEVTRVCTTGERNACSMLYGALNRSAAALGFVRSYTYTLANEDAASVKAAGYVFDGFVKRESSWSRPSRVRSQEKRDDGPKSRWVRYLTKVLAGANDHEGTAT